MEPTLGTTKNTRFTRISVSPACTDSDQGQDLEAFQTQDNAVIDTGIVSGSPRCHQSSNCATSVFLSVPDKSMTIRRNNHVKLLSEQQLSAGVVQKTPKNPRSRSDVDGPHTAEVAKKRRRLSWNQTTSPLSEPSSTPGSTDLSTYGTAGRSDTGPRGWKQARLSQGALARRQIFLRGMLQQRTEVQEADEQLLERKKRGNDDISRAGESAVIDADPHTDALGIESLAFPDAGSTQISTDPAAGVSNSHIEKGTWQLRQPVSTSVSALHTEKPSNGAPSQRRAVRDPAAHLVAARAQIISRPFVSATRPVLLSGSCRNPLVLFRPRQPLVSIQMATWSVPLPSFHSSTGPPNPQANLASTKGEIDCEEEEDENELAFPTFKYESRYFASDYEEDGMEIFADFAGLWPQSGDGLQTDMDAEFEEMGTFGISTFG
ncbi:uncharacterized protein PgNI_08093 [Pyricularia grisea]|uniref:Uncharacterized protein n=1 Tax=Pyricularia grisea TaxID=148305 RepID=A0A6P8AUG1_PYRGI|nr:uncharacterized protein PgNI_08093 [Pyricularia grisea]TLD05856.1 hypothetical protein PgNI_08093 [Pyricularia grisea]